MFRMHRTLAQFAAVLIGAALLTGSWSCRQVGGPCPTTTLTISPNPVTIAVGTTALITATGRDCQGNVVSSTATWSVVGGGGTINSGTGLYTAGSVAGTYNNSITAVSGNQTATATVIVTGNAGALATLTLTPSPGSVLINGTQQFVATGRDGGGNIVAVTPTWSVVAGGGVINSSGMFTAGGTAGTFSNTIRATSGAISGLATVVVSSSPGALATITLTPNPATMLVNGTQQFTAVGKDANGNAVAITPTWSVVAGGGIINTSGSFTAGAAGTFANTIRATSGGISGFATVNVNPAAPGALATITLTPNPSAVVAGGTQQFVATGRDGNGNFVAITPAWSVVSGGGAINASGLFTAGAVTGTYSSTVHATSGLVTGVATVNVTATAAPGALGVAGTYAILAGTTITNTGVTTTVVGDLGLSPGTAITGIPAGQPTGGLTHAGDATAAAAQAALTSAYNDLAGRPCGTNMSSVDMGGTTLAPGVYCFNSSAALTGTVTLDGQGNTNAVFVIQVGSALTTATNSSVNLIGGAQAKNVYWQVGSSATLGTGTSFKGNLVALQSITMNSGASLTGRALARNGGVTLDTNAIHTP